VVNRSDGRGYVENDDRQVLHKSDETVWAVSKLDSGDGYKLTEETYAALIQHVECARRRIDQTIEFLQPMVSSSKDLVTKDGKLTPLGLVADHFNFIKLRDIKGKDFFPGRWELRTQSAPNVNKGDLQVLLDTVRQVLSATLKGLNRPLVLRGKADTPEVAKLAGYVIRRSDRARGADIDFPDGKLPKLWKDMVFLNPDAQAKGHIHVDYTTITFPASVAGSLLSTDTCLTWTIIHEATHKFARTRDVASPSCYDFDGCRRMNWKDAVRNAKHYEILCGLNWDTIPWGNPVGSKYVMANGKLVGDQS